MLSNDSRLPTSTILKNAMLARDIYQASLRLFDQTQNDPGQHPGEYILLKEKLNEYATKNPNARLTSILYTDSIKQILETIQKFQNPDEYDKKLLKILSENKTDSVHPANSVAPLVERLDTTYQTKISEITENFKENFDLHSATLNYDMEQLTRLLEKNDIDINQKDQSKMTALYSAISIGNIEAVKLLLDKGADPNIECDRIDNRQTALHLALKMLVSVEDNKKQKYSEIIQLLLADKKIDLTIKDKFGKTYSDWLTIFTNTQKLTKEQIKELNDLSKSVSSDDGLANETTQAMYLVRSKL